MSNEPDVKVIVDGVDITEEPHTRRSSVDPLLEMRGILKAIRIITHCPEGDSILTHVATITRRLDRMIERHGKDFAP